MRFSSSPKFNDWAHSQTITPAGRIVTAGVQESLHSVHLAVGRLLPTGAADDSFGAHGGVVVGQKETYFARAVAIQHQAGELKTVVAVATIFTVPGGYNHRCSIMRLDPDGSLDPTFGHGGIVVVSFPQNSGECEGMAVDPNGDIVATVDAATHGGDVALFRLRGSDGSLDPTFGNGGKVTVNEPGFQASGQLALVPVAGAAYHVLVAGTASIGTKGWDWAVWELSDTGALVPGFGSGGRAIVAMRDHRVTRSFDEATDVAVAADGTIALGGDYRAWPSGQQLPTDTAAVAELTAQGARVTTFGRNGASHVPYNPDVATGVASVAIQPDDSVVYAGTLVPTVGQVIIGGWTSTGGADSAFGKTGYLEPQIGGDYTAAGAIALDSRGRLVVSATGGVEGVRGDAFAVLRFALSG